MSYAEIHLKGGTIVRFECTRLKVGNSPLSGELLGIEYDQPAGYTVAPVAVDGTQIAAALLIDGPMPK